MTRLGNRAIDLPCPKCGKPAGTYCNGEGVGVDLCQVRINLAMKITREANRAAIQKARE